MDSLQIVDVHLAADNLDELLAGCELYLIDSHLVDLVDDAGVVGREDLGAVVPVGLVAVVLARIMAGGDVHTSLGTELTDGEGYLRCRTQTLKEVDLDAVGREDVGTSLGKKARVVAAVMAHNHGEVAAAGESLEDIIGKILGGHAHNVAVHAVGAGSHDAAQSTGAELEVLVEGVDEGGLVGVTEHSLHLGTGLLVKVGGEPLLGSGGTLLYKFLLVCHSCIIFLKFEIYLSRKRSPVSSIIFFLTSSG